MESRDECTRGDVDLHFNLEVQERMQNFLSFNRIDQLENDLIYEKHADGFDKKEVAFCKQALRNKKNEGIDIIYEKDHFKWNPELLFSCAVEKSANENMRKVKDHFRARSSGQNGQIDSCRNGNVWGQKATFVGNSSRGESSGRNATKNGEKLRRIIEGNRGLFGLEKFMTMKKKVYKDKTLTELEGRMAGDFREKVRLKSASHRKEQANAQIKDKMDTLLNDISRDSIMVKKGIIRNDFGAKKKQSVDV